jgi:hypothetical protein
VAVRGAVATLNSPPIQSTIKEIGMPIATMGLPKAVDCFIDYCAKKIAYQIVEQEKKENNVQL